MDIQTKDELLEQISLAVEQIQKTFANRNDVIRDCEETYLLCKCVDNILHHGLKEGLISWATEPSIWPVLEKITCAKDIEEINMLHLKTDKERCSRWIRMAVNVNLLGSYISTLHQDKSLLSNHYYVYAFLRDPVLVETIKSLLNYGIANFDFQISVDWKQMPKFRNEAKKQEKQVNGDEFAKTDPAVRRNDSFHKKKRKKRPTIGVITDLDNHDDADAPNIPFPETESLINGENVRDSLKSGERIIRETNDANDMTDAGSTDGPSKRLDVDSVQFSNSENAEITGSELAVNQNSDLDTTASSETSLDHQVTAVNDNLTEQRMCEDGGDEQRMCQDKGDEQRICEDKGDEQRICEDGGDEQRMCQDKGHEQRICEDGGDEQRMCEDKGDEQRMCEDKGGEWTAGETGDIDESHGQTEAGTSEVEQNTCTQSSANEAQQPERDSAASGENVDLGYLVTKSLTDLSSSARRKEISANDFHLEDSIVADDCNVSDVHDASSLPKSDSVHSTCEALQAYSTTETSEVHSTTKTPKLHTTAEAPELQSTVGTTEGHSSPKTEHSDSETLETGNLGNNDEITASKTHNSRSKKSASSEDSCSGKRLSAQDDQQRDDCKEFSESPDEGEHNYRVTKVENAEFVSSSYGSSFSDFMGTSYDDRDLNFIPGIHDHRKTSGQKLGTSYDAKVSFDEVGLPIFDTSHYLESSSSRPSSLDDASGRFSEIANEWDVFDDLLNVEEGHFSGPDSFVGLTTSEELEIAIDHYKNMIKVKQEKSMDRDELVQKLIKLRLRLQHERDGPPVVNPKFRKILSHHFHKEKEATGNKHTCDQCGNVIWPMWQSLFTCNDCGYHSHRKCLEHIERQCPNRNLSSLSYIMEICPDTGLDGQQYRCAECRKGIAFSKAGVAEARLCDYTGQYFCDHCHWNDQVCIPARVLRNWDFSQYKVCRQTKQLLDLIKTRPLLNLQQVNPMLFRYVQELREVGKLREDILVMKKYFLTCREALESKLLIQLQKRQHFVDNSKTYSFQDLLDLNNDVLVPEISKIHALFLAHIKSDCELCRARGFICEVCQDSSDVIFAFDPHAIKCTKCGTVFHKNCFKPEDCPKCHRRRKIVDST